MIKRETARVVCLFAIAGWFIVGPLVGYSRDTIAIAIMVFFACQIILSVKD